MSVEQTVNICVKELELYLKVLPNDISRDQKIKTIDYFIMGTQTERLDTKPEVPCYLLSYQMGYAAISQFGPQEIDTAKELLNAKLENLRKKLEKKSIFANFRAYVDNFLTKYGGTSMYLWS